jgi:hypothetical protein
MIRAIFCRETCVWFAMIVITILSFELGHGIGAHDIEASSLCTLALAFFKARLVLFEFMEIRFAPIVMRLIANVWVVIVWLALSGHYIRLFP